MEKAINMKERIFRSSAAILTVLLMMMCIFALSTSSTYAASKPGATSITSASGVSESQINVKWKKIKKANLYQVYRNGKLVKTTSSTSFSDKKLAEDTKYTYKVRSVKKTYKKSKMWYNKKTHKYQKKKPAKKYRGKSKTVKTAKYKYGKMSGSKTAATKRLAAPSLKASDTCESIKLSWSKLTRASGYIVYKDGAELAETSSTSYTDSAVSTGETYSYYVVAVTSSGMTDASNTATITMKGHNFVEKTETHKEAYEKTVQIPYTNYYERCNSLVYDPTTGKFKTDPDTGEYLTCGWRTKDTSDDEKRKHLQHDAETGHGSWSTMSETLYEDYTYTDYRDVTTTYEQCSRCGLKK